MYYWDNDFDRMFDEAIDELAKQEPYTDEQIEEMYQEHLMRTNISKPMAIMGAV